MTAGRSDRADTFCGQLVFLLAALWAIVADIENRSYQRSWSTALVVLLLLATGVGCDARGAADSGPLPSALGGGPAPYATCLALGPSGTEYVGQSIGFWITPDRQIPDGLEISSVDAELSGPIELDVAHLTSPPGESDTIPFNISIPTDEFTETSARYASRPLPLELGSTDRVQQVAFFVRFTSVVEPGTIARAHVVGYRYDHDGRSYRMPADEWLSVVAAEPFTEEADCGPEFEEALGS